MSGYEYKEGIRAPIKHWTKGLPIESSAEEQLRNISSLPFIHKHIAVMPDVHMGKGATVGSVIPTKGAIIPAAVGVDIGCGMIAQRTSLTAWDLPENLKEVRADIERAIPHGFVSISGRSRQGMFIIPSNSACSRWKTLEKRYEQVLEKHPKIAPSDPQNPLKQLGSLGGGNHFIEICLDEEDRVWVMLHSGSRGIGNIMGRYFMDLAKEDMRIHHINLMDRDLSYLSEGTRHFDDYIEAMLWAQDYASENRLHMMDSVLNVLRKHFKAFTTDKHAINCHHNYATRENHFGENVWVTRKGAVRARKGDLGIIPGSMGTGSFIVEGLGNEESFCSCSHGAGRKMSRGEAKKKITIEEHRKAMKGIEARVDTAILDESPRAYKDINSVMDAQSDLVKIKFRLRQILNVKG